MIALDWLDATHWNGGRRAACIHCHRPALLLDDAGRPAHKVCVEAAVAQLGEPRSTDADYDNADDDY